MSLGLPPRLRDVQADGSCFFRAIYNAAKQQGVAEEMIRCLRDDRVSCARVPSEREFVTCVRSALADRIRDQKDFGMVDNFVHWLGDDDSLSGNLELFDEMYGFPTTYKTFLRSAFEGGVRSERFRSEVRRALADHFEDPRNYVGELEVTLVKNVVKSCTADASKPIEIEVLSQNRWNEMTRAGWRPRPTQTVKLYLVNLGEAHYNWVDPAEAPEPPRFQGEYKAKSPPRAPRSEIRKRTRAVAPNPSLRKRSRSPVAQNRPSASKGLVEPQGCDRKFASSDWRLESKTPVGDGWWVYRVSRLNGDRIYKFWCQGGNVFETWAQVALVPSVKANLSLQRNLINS